MHFFSNYKLISILFQMFVTVLEMKTSEYCIIWLLKSHFKKNLKKSMFFFKYRANLGEIRHLAHFTFLPNIN